MKEKTNVTFDQLLSSMLLLYSTNIDCNKITNVLGEFASKYHNYNLVDGNLNTKIATGSSIIPLSSIIDDYGCGFKLHDGLSLDTVISENKSVKITVADVLTLRCGKSLYNDMSNMKNGALSNTSNMVNSKEDGYSKVMH